MTPQRFAASTLAALAASDHRIVITGASGWLGTATLELLHDALGDTFATRVRCFGSAARMLSPTHAFAIAQRPLAEIGALPPAATLVLHLAFLTKDRVAGMDADAYAAANAALSATVLAALDRIGTEAVFVASSGAARAADDPAADHAMRLYGALKRRDEEDFAAWADRSGKRAVVTRIFNVAGPYINKHQSYALAAFINDALAGRAIVVRAPHRVIRGYVAIRELMSLVFALLLDAAAETVVFDTGGAAMELGDVAQAVADTLGLVPVERAAIVAERIDHYVGDGAIYDKLRVRYAIPAVSLAAQIRDTANSLIAAPDVGD